MFSTFFLMSFLLSSPAKAPGPQVDQSEMARYSQQARQAMAEKNWDAAAKALAKLAQLAPDVPEVHGNLGLAYYSEGRISLAAQAFERALKLNPKMGQARLTLGLCYAELGRHDEAVAILDPIFQRIADRKMGRLVGLDLERSYVGLQQYAKAAQVSDELLRRYPDDPEILFQVSRFYADRAYQTMRRLIQAAPDSVWEHYATAEVQESLQHFDLAIAEYRSVLELEPRMPGIHYRIGRALLRRGKDPKAVDSAFREFEQELAIAPESAEAEYELGEILRQRAELDKSLQHFSRAVKLQPQLEEAQIGLARTLIVLGRTRDALAHLTEAVRLNPENEVSHFLLASVYKALGETPQHQRELSTFQRLHAAGPRRGQAALRIPGALARSEVTEQTLDSEAGSPP